MPGCLDAWIFDVGEVVAVEVVFDGAVVEVAEVVVIVVDV